MISQKVMLDIILTEALEEPFSRPVERDGNGKELTINYPLRVVRGKDGSLHWEDRDES